MKRNSLLILAAIVLASAAFLLFKQRPEGTEAVDDVPTPMVEQRSDRKLSQFVERFAVQGGQDAGQLELDKIQSALRSGDEEARMDAFAKLLKMGSGAIAASEDELLDLLDQPEGQLRSNALFALSKNKDIAAKHLAKINDQLESEDGAVVDSALHTISKIGAAATESVVPVMGLLSSPDPSVREDAAFVLGRIGKNAEASLERLLDLLDSDPSPKAKDAYRNAIRLIAGGNQYLSENSTPEERKVFEADR